MASLMLGHDTFHPLPTTLPFTVAVQGFRINFCLHLTITGTGADQQLPRSLSVLGLDVRQLLMSLRAPGPGLDSEAWATECCRWLQATGLARVQGEGEDEVLALSVGTTLNLGKEGEVFLLRSPAWLGSPAPLPLRTGASLCLHPQGAALLIVGNVRTRTLTVTLGECTDSATEWLLRAVMPCRQFSYHVHRANRLACLCGFLYCVVSTSTEASGGELVASSGARATAALRMESSYPLAPDATASLTAVTTSDMTLHALLTLCGLDRYTLCVCVVCLG